MTYRVTLALCTLTLIALITAACTESPGSLETERVAGTSARGEGTLLVREDGPRWLGPSWWLGVGVDPATLSEAGVQIVRNGEVIPYLVLASPEGPGVLFYAETEPDALASELGVGPAAGYTLRLGTSDHAADIITITDASPSSCQATTEAYTVLGADAVFRPTAPVNPPWLWHSLRPVEGITSTVVLTNAVEATPITLTISAWGQSDVPQDPDHHLRLLWSGNVIDDHLWDGNGVESWSVEVDAARGSEHTLGVIAPGGTEAPVELTWLDQVGVVWQQALVATHGKWQHWLAGADSTACFQAAEVNDRDQFIAVFSSEDGGVHYVIPDWDSGAATAYVAQTAGSRGWLGVPWTAPPPDVVRPLETLDESVALAADYLIVAPRQFHDGLEPLVEARSAEGLTVAVVTPEAVYDAYHSGIPTALSLQSLVGDLHGRGNLETLLLVGDASADPASVWESTSTVPTMWVRTGYFGATASDYAIATGGGDVPLVAVGRLPVATTDELDILVRKTLSWDPNDRLLLISDDEPTFSSLTEQLGEIAAPDLVVDAGMDGARRAILDWLGDGPGTLVYTGHGSMGLLGDEKLLLLEDGASWRQPTVVAAWSCLCASFAHPKYASLAEAWLVAPRGVVAVVGPTGETTTAEQSAMALALQTSLAEGESLGQALLTAWRASQSENTKHGFVLLGDPGLRPMSVQRNEGERSG